MRQRLWQQQQQKPLKGAMSCERSFVVTDLLVLSTSAQSAVLGVHQGFTRRHYWSEDRGETHSDVWVVSIVPF